MTLTWTKLGKIFDPIDHPLARNFIGFAQSPQPLVYDDFVRIYFSTRLKDSQDEKKFISHIQYVDFSKNFKTILGTSTHEVIPLGGRGCFGEHGIFPMNVVRYQDRIYAYTTDLARRISVPADSAIGFAMSDDNGKTFKRYGTGPVMAASLHEPFIIADGCVRHIDGLFHMWYIYGTGWKKPTPDAEPERVYKIGYASSKDGIEWQQANRRLIADKLDENECQALPTVVEFDGLYHMFFCYRDMAGFRTDRNKAYRIGYAWSTDMQNWMRDDERGGMTVSEAGWDSDMQCYPHVFECNGQIYLLYNGNEFGRHGFGLAVLERRG